MTLEALLLLVSGGFLSLLQELWDGWGPWLGEQSPLAKRLVTLGSLLVAALAVFGVACVGWLELVAPGVVVLCEQSGVLVLLEAFFLLAVGSQTLHKLVKRS
jgi:hypothetical protein